MEIQPRYNDIVDVILDELALFGSDTLTADDRMGARVRDSVAAAGLMQRLSQRLDRTVPLAAFWAYPTAAALAGYLAGSTPPPESSSLDGAVAGGDEAVEPIAIIGLACRLPGARDAGEFRRLLMAGRCALGPAPDYRGLGGRCCQRRQKPCPPGGFLPEVAGFDRRAFGISAHESCQMDPQQKLVLEVGWSAIEDAGWNPLALKDARGGVFIGAMWNDFTHHVAAGEMTSHSAIGLDTSIISARLSFLLGLSGPALTVNTACSSSLVAIHLACQSLRAGECGFALAGGVNLILAEHSDAAMRALGVISPSGACHAFAARADGYARAEGCGILLLKSLAAALADNDHIYGTLCASGVNNNGYGSSITAPSARAQESLMRGVCRQAGIAPGDIQYLEAHGTGTLLGDPIEAAAAARVYCQGQGRSSPLVVGSVKANIGHCEAASGVAGLIKILLAMHDCHIPPQAHFHHPNPHIDLPELGISIPRQRLPWPRCDGGRLAAVSSFGFGGTNAHAIIADTWRSRWRATCSTQPATGGKINDAPANHGPVKTVAGAPANHGPVKTVAGAPAHHGPVKTVAGAPAHHGPAKTVAGAPAECPPVAAVADGRGATLLFSGQGSHWTGMGLELARIDPAFRIIIKACDEAVQKLAGWSLAGRLYNRQENFADIRIAWPCHLAVQLAIAGIWQARGLPVAAVAGHSIGELAAAHWAGMLSLEDAFAISLAQAGWAAGQRGGMALIGLGWGQTGALLEQTGLSAGRAIEHHDSATVISGSAETLAELRSVCMAQRIDFTLVNTSAAVHLPVEDPRREALETALPRITAAPPKTRFYSGMAGDNAAANGLPWTHWRDLLIKPLHWYEQLKKVMKAERPVFIEIAPHPILLSILTRDNLPKRVAVASARRNQSAPEVMNEAMVRLSLQGIDFAAGGAGAETGGGSLQRQIQPETAYWLLPVSARSPDILGMRCGQLAALLEDPAISLADLSATLAARTAHYGCRTAFVVADRQRAQQALTKFARRTEKRGGGNADGMPVKRVGLVCSARACLLPEDLAELMAEPVFRLCYKRGQTALQSRSIPDATGIGSAFLQQIALAALLSCYGVSRVEFLGIGDGEVIAGYLRGDLTLTGAIEQLHRVPDRPVQAGADISQGESSEKILAPARNQQLDVLIPLTLGINKAVSTEGDAALAVHRHRQWFKPASGTTRERLLRLLGRLYTLGSMEDAARLGGQGNKIILPEQPWRHDKPTDPVTSSIEPLIRHPGPMPDLNPNLPINLFTQRWVAAADSVEPDCRYAGEGLAIFAGPGLKRQLASLPFCRQALWVECGDRYQWDHPAVSVNPADPEHFIRLLETCPVDTILYFWGWAEPAGAGSSMRGMLEASLNLARAMALKKLGNIKLRFVTAGCQPAGMAPVRRPEQALLWGLARTLRLEQPEMDCRIADIDAIDSGALFSGQAMVPLQDIIGDGAEENAWRDDQRYIPALCVSPAVPPSPPQAPGSGDSTGFYLISGGLGAFGLHLAHWLLDRGINNIALVGRRPADETARQAVAALEQRGARVREFAADVADLPALENVVSLAERSLGRLTGIIHAAGILAGGFIRHSTAESHYEALRGKAEGAWNLHQLTRRRPVEAFILVSSASSVLGLSRYAGYAAANAYLDALAWLRRGAGLPALSVGFGPFADAGLALSEPALMNAPSLPALTMAEGIEGVNRALAVKSAHLVIMRYDAVRRGQFSQHAASAARPADVAASAVSLSSVPPGQRAALVAGIIGRQVAALTGCDSERLSDTLPLHEAGVDSLTGIELRNRLQREFGVSLPVTLLWDCPTRAELAAVILSRVPAAPADRPAKCETHGGDGGETATSAKAATAAAGGPATIVINTGRAQAGGTASAAADGPVSGYPLPRGPAAPIAEMSDWQAEQQLREEMAMVARKFGLGEPL